jgi:TANFOR domain-containing protein
MHTHSETTIRLFAFLTGLVFLFSGAQAQQDINVITQVLPPYSPYLSDYVSIENKVVITLTNTQPVQKSVRLVGRIEGDGGITITIPQDYMPPQSIDLAPNETRALMGFDLQAYLNPDVLQFSGISKSEVVQGNGLPEGEYSFCVQAVDYQSGVPLSLPAPSGCAYFSITHYEPPEIVQPLCNGIAAAQTPQNLLLSWTIPAGAPPQHIEYVVTIVEMIPQQVDATQAVLAATDPPFFSAVSLSNSFLYGPDAPILEKGKRYAWRVTARSRQGAPKLLFKNNGHSGACFFHWQDGMMQQGDGDQDDDQDNVDIEQQYAADCDVLNCAPQPIATGPAANKNYIIGDEVQIGYFIMRLTQLSSSSASSLSGEGEIDIPLFNTKLKASFSNLQINAQNKVFSGVAIGAYDPGAQVNQALKDFSNNLDNITGEYVKGVSDYVRNAQKYVDNFVNVNAVGLPFAMNKLISGNMQLINIAAIEFAPDGARLNAFFDMPIPEANNKILAFGQKNLCFHPTGLSVGGLQKLTMLGNDYTFAWGPNIDCTIKAVGGNNGGTFVAWDCEGFKEIQIDGSFTFKNGMLKAKQGNDPVTASFKFTGAAWGDLLGEITMTPFTIAGLEGLNMTVDKVIMDFSDTRNAMGMAYPANYQGAQGNDWRGFYFSNITIVLPDYLKKGNEPISITMSNALINKQGFTGTVTVQPVFSTDQGNLGGWAFSMDKIEIEISNNTLSKGGFNGKLRLPISNMDLGYSCVLSNSQQGLKTDFAVENLGDIDVDMWGASLSIKPGSSVNVEAQGNDVLVQAVLSGELTINKQFPDMKSVSVNIPDVEFKDFTIRNKKPYFSAEYFKFASAEKNFAGFPISIDPEKGIMLKFDGDDRIGLQLAFNIGLDGNQESALSGGTAFTVWGKMSMQNNKQKWSLDKPELNSIWIDASIAACEIKGSVDLYKNDVKFGNGFRGALEVTFRPLVKVSATVQFGSTNFNSASTYRYWYFDGMAVMGTGIPIYPGLGIYGFGGGAYYRMKPVSAIPNAASLSGNPDNVDGFDLDSPGQSSTGVVYEPDKNIAFGFKATIVLGTMPSPKAFNGDITIEASFFQGGGLNEISLSGNGYFVQIPDPKARPGNDAVIQASVFFKYAAQQKTFDGLISINFNLKAGNKPLITGGGDAALHFSPDKWFIKFGEPDNRFALSVLGLLDIDSYFMIGKNSLPGMPDLPSSPIDFYNKLPGFNEQNPRNSEVGAGSGFAMGKMLSVDTGKLKFLVFYAHIAIAFGYDVSILHTDATCANVQGKMGMNGWYATGQVYAGIEAKVGIDINLWFVKKDIVLFEVGLIAALKGGLPNPTWLQGQVAGYYNIMNGLLTGHCTFKFKYGEVCDPNEGDPFGGLKVISEVTPMGNDVDCFVFPEVAFNLPVGNDKVMSVQVLKDKDETEIISFRFNIKTFEIRKKSGNVKVAGSFAKFKNDMLAQFEPNEMLDEMTEFTTKVEIHGDRFVNGQWTRIKACANCQHDHVETRTVHFKTGKAPEYFRDDLIIETRPARMQRYYAYSQHHKGFINFKQYPSNIPALQPDDPNYQYRYEVRFHKVGGGASVVGTSPLEWENSQNFKGVRFVLPSHLKETIYIAQIVRVRELKSGKQEKDGFALVQEKKAVGDGQTVSQRRAKLNSTRIGDNEFLVYQMAYKTSRFSQYHLKLQNYLSNLESTYRLSNDKNTHNYNKIMLRFKGDEPLDPYDLQEYSYKKGSITHYVQPIMRAEARNRAGAGTNEPYWNWMYNRYYRYSLDDSYINNVYIASLPLNGGPNPNTVRVYPPSGLYRPGSRLTHGTRLSNEKFPLWATDIAYQGNMAANKLTNQEINAVFWKGYNPPPQGLQAGVKIAANAVKVANNNPMLNHQTNIKINEINKLVLRYDVPAVLERDRGLIVEELMRRYGNVLGQTPAFWHFMRYNLDASRAQAIGVQNHDFWDMKIRNNTSVEFRFHVEGLGYTINRTYKFKD